MVSSCGVLINTYPFRVSVPLPLPVPYPILSHVPFAHSILCSHSFPGYVPTTLHLLISLAVVIMIAIARKAVSTARRTGIGPVVIIIILID